MDGLALLEMDDPVELLIAQAVLSRAHEVVEERDKSRAHMIANALSRIL